MKKYELVCSSGVKKFCIDIFVTVLIFGIMAFVFADIDMLLYLIPFVLVQYIIYKNILGQYKITKTSISSRYIEITWNEIRDCSVFFPEIRMSNLKMRTYPPIICIGSVTQNGFFFQSKKKCVFIPLTQRNLELIKEYYEGENQEIKAMLEQYLGYPEYPDLKIH